MSRNKNLYLISAYAQTLKKSEKDPEDRNAFYSQLDSVVSKISSKHLVLVLGDFNAKIGIDSYDEENSNILGKFLRSNTTNSSGEYLLEFAINNKFTIANSKFMQKSSRLCTLESNDGKTKNQIDYILIRSNYINLVTNTRTYCDFDTYTHHKLLVLKIQFEWHKITNQKRKSEPRINRSLFSEQKYRDEYKTKTEE